MKAFADRELDWVDLTGILLRQKNLLDWDYIFSQLTPLAQLKEAPAIITRLKKLRRETS